MEMEMEERNKKNEEETRMRRRRRRGKDEPADNKTEGRNKCSACLQIEAREINGPPVSVLGERLLSLTGQEFLLSSIIIIMVCFVCFVLVYEYTRSCTGTCTSPTHSLPHSLSCSLYTSWQLVQSQLKMLHYTQSAIFQHF